MLSSITPLGERGRHNRWGITAVAYLVGSLGGGAAVGALAGGAGQVLGLAWPGAGGLPATVALVVLAVVAAVGLALDAGVGGLRIPTIRRQVDENWLSEYRGWVYGLGYGFQLGIGVVTIVTSAVTYTALVAAVLTGSWLGGLIVGTTFGLVRALPLLLTARVRHPQALRRLHERNQRLAQGARRAAVAGQGAAAVVAVAVLVLA